MKHLFPIAAGITTLLMVSGVQAQERTDRPTLTARANTVRLAYPISRLKTKIIKPVVKRRVLRRLAPVSPSKYGPNTKVTIGQYDQNGNIDGAKVLTGKQIEDGFSRALGAHKLKFRKGRLKLKPDSLRKLERNGLKTQIVQKKRVFDRELNTNIEVVEIPQELETSNNLLTQKLKLVKLPLRPVVIARPIIVNPGPTHAANPYSRNAGYDKTWGKTSRFAAYLKAKVSAYGARNKREAKAEFGAGGHVFSKKISLIDFRSRVTRFNNSNSGHSRLKVLGSVKWERNGSNPSANLTYTREKSYRQRFWLGPLPVSVGGALGGSVGINLNLFAPDAKSIEGQAKPFIDSYGAADAAIDVWLARAGIEGKLRIVKDSLPSKVRLRYVPNKQELKFKLQVKNELRALDGKISVYAKVRKLFGGWRKWSKTLLNWNGFSKTWFLIDRELTAKI